MIMALSADTLVTVVSALVGALVGSVGATFLGDWLSQRDERRRAYEQVVQSYLAQLQDASELLWGRLRNMTGQGGSVQSSLNPEDAAYFIPTILYALGKLLAQRYILNLKGAYAEIERLKPGLGRYLHDRLDTVDRTLGDISASISSTVTIGWVPPEMMGSILTSGIAYQPFYTFDRQALAESVLHMTDDHVETITYVTFRSSYDAPGTSTRITLEPTRQFVTILAQALQGYIPLNGPSAQSATALVMNTLSEIADRLESETGISTSSERRAVAQPVQLPPSGT